MADIIIINPRFDISFWGLEHCMPLFGKRANLPVVYLALLAALVPDHHEVTLIDENVEDIDFERRGRAHSPWDLCHARHANAVQFEPNGAAHTIVAPHEDSVTRSG